MEGEFICAVIKYFIQIGLVIIILEGVCGFFIMKELDKHSITNIIMTSDNSFSVDFEGGKVNGAKIYNSTSME